MLFDDSVLIKVYVIGKPIENITVPQDARDDICYLA